MAAIEGFGRALDEADPLAPDVSEREDYHRAGERMVSAYRDLEPRGNMAPLGEFAEDGARAAGDLIGAVAVFIGTLPGCDPARRFGETAAQGVRGALGIFLSPSHNERITHQQAAIEGFAGQLAGWVIGGFATHASRQAPQGAAQN